MTRDLTRLLRPASIAVIGGGAWCRSVLDQLAKAQFDGDVWHVHPSGANGAYRDLDALPTVPDAAFIGVNRDTTLGVIEKLAQLGAGGAVCFASGFAEVADGQDRNADLLRAAGQMPILGPNCYGFINALDGALLWPDQHGCLPCDTGVAILTQSSNIAINLTMQARALPIAYVVTCGNQAQTTQAEIAMALLDDPRVTAIGLHIEGFGDLQHWQAFARAARDRGLPVLVLKVGASVEAQAATVSHTASLAGSDAGARAFIARLGLHAASDPSVFLETLKILHIAGPLPTKRIATISCSGGEASLAADIAAPLGLTFPALNTRQTAKLAQVLGPRVTLANPLDYHTYIWRDTDAMTDAFSAMVDPALALTLLIVDVPRSDRCDPSDWACAVDAAIATRARTGGQIAMVASLPELMPENVAQDLMADGVIPLCGLSDALLAVVAAQQCEVPDIGIDVLHIPLAGESRTVPEGEAKQSLAAYGLRIPRHRRLASADRITNPPFGYPVVLKGEGFAHKTESGAVALHLLDLSAVQDAASRMQADSYIIEEMISGGVAELIVGVVNDAAHGFVLTIGAGGTLAELLGDTQSVLLPASRATLETALCALKIHTVLVGYRGQPSADINTILDAIEAIAAYVLANAATVHEVEVNPLICTPTAAIAADALIRKAP